MGGNATFAPVTNALDDVSVAFAGGSSFSPVASGSVPFGLDPATPLSASATTQTVTSATFTPTYANGLLVVGVQCGATANLNTVASISDTSGLVWTKEVVQPFASGGDREITQWTAPYTGTYSGAVTVHLATAGVYNMRYFLTAVSNPNATPMDANAGNPFHNNSGNAQTQAASAVVSTNATKTILLALLCSNVSLGTVTRPSGFTQVINAGTAADFSYKVLSSPASSVTEAWTWTGTSDFNALGIIAIQSA
jgi:hypothetical protein